MNFIINVFLNIYYVSIFFLKKQCKILYFKIPLDKLLPFLHNNVVLDINNRIENAYIFSQSKYFNIKCSKDSIAGLEQNEKIELKKIVKMGWLIQNIRMCGVKNPIQLIKYGNKYICHPGTDRILIASILFPKDILEGIYLCYENTAQFPFILNYNSKEIKNPITFLCLFSYSKNFKFKTVKMNKKLNTYDSNNTRKSNAMFSLAKTAFNKTGEDYNYNFLSFYDDVQWKNIYNKMSISDVISFKSDKECVFSGIVFKKNNGVWRQCIK